MHKSYSQKIDWENGLRSGVPNPWAGDWNWSTAC